MTLRRILTIVIVLLVLVGLLFGASWYFSRRTAERNGATPLTFRQFLGIGTPVAPGQQAKGEFVSQFTTDTTTDKNSNGVLDGEEDQNFNGSLDKDDIILNAEGQNTDIFNNRVKGSINVSTLVFSRFADSNANRINDWNEDRDGNSVIDGIEDLDGNGTIDGYDGGLVIDGNSTNGGNPNDDNNLDPNGLTLDNGGFTSGPLMPVGSGLGTGGNPGGVPGMNGTFSGTTGTASSGPTTSKTNDDNTSPIALPTDGASTAKYCNDADMNISFNANEIARLNVLRTRFDAIAPTLYDDNASDEQLSFYSSFKIKELQTAELMNYCRAKLPYISDPKLKRLVPTPFYHDSTLDTNTFTNNPISTSDFNNNSKGYRPLFDNPITASTFLERIFRINIW